MDYKYLYHKLFNALTDLNAEIRSLLEKTEAIQLQSEELFMEHEIESNGVPKSST